MRRIGIVGGLGPESTVDYYRMIIEEYGKQKAGHAPEIIIYSLNMKDFPDRRQEDEIINWLLHAVKSLHKAGADFGLIASNTPHIVFDELEQLSPMPLLSIVRETCRVVQNMNLGKVGLMGTKVTMSSDYYQRVFSLANIPIVVPNAAEKAYISDKLVSEIVFNRIVEETRQGLLKIAKRLVDDEGIEGLILGCTELPLILTNDAYGIRFLNTSRIHAESAVRFCLTGK
jgi:aspartate racemase